MFTQVIIRKRKTDGRTADGQMDRRPDTDVQHETIIPRHYCVAESLVIYSLSSGNKKTDRRMYDGRTDEKSIDVNSSYHPETKNGRTDRRTNTGMSNVKP